MRMWHYYAGLAALLVPMMLATVGLGLAHDGSQKHLALGLLTSVLCVATNTAFILFMIVTGRILKQASAARPLSPTFLAELNQFFANKRGYPLSLFSAVAAVATAVLGYGPNIGVPSTVHMLLGIGAVLLNLYTIPIAVATLRGNQGLMDRVALELDRIEKEIGPAPEEASEIPWTYGVRTRWIVFGVSAWGPYLYWGLVVWRGDFGALHPIFAMGSAMVSGYGFRRAWLAGPDAREDGTDAEVATEPDAAGRREG